MRITLLNCVVCLLFAVSCKKATNENTPADTPTSGSLTVMADASLFPLVDAEEDAFEGMYKRVKVDVKYVSEIQAVEALLSDSVKLIIVSRQLTSTEKSRIEKLKINVQQIPIASEGIAMIVNKQNPDSLMRLDQLRSIISGDSPGWKDLNATSSLDNVTVVFNQPNSSLVRYIYDSLYAFSELPPNCFALESDTAVIDYVTHNKNALGMISGSWISDEHDVSANRYLASVRVVSVSRDSVFYPPYQGYIADQRYPLTRSIYMISREARAGLASGFISYVASDRGQRVVLKAGLVPAYPPAREVEINNAPF